MKWLVTGGAGYIGAHVADSLLESGNELVIVDSLINSDMRRLNYLSKKWGKERVRFIRGDIRDKELINSLVSNSNIKGCIHLAALKSVPNSFTNPDLYLDVNVNGTKTLLDAISGFGIEKFIFSSTAAVYKEGINQSLTETSAVQPLSPYGRSKLEAEEAINNFAALNEVDCTSLRYFNVIGKSNIELEDKSQDNLIPIITDSILNNKAFLIFGNDYQTRDGTCIRDFVDVRDVAQAHLQIINSSNPPKVLNIGSGKGVSVLEATNFISMALGKKIDIKFAQRRAGDLPIVIASINLAQSQFGYTPRYDFLDSILR